MALLPFRIEFTERAIADLHRRIDATRWPAIAIDEGWTAKDGRLPVNASGGLKAKGHPIGATGVSMHVLASMQARGEAGAMQVRRSGPTAVFNMGGTAVANYVSILEAEK